MRQPRLRTRLLLIVVALFTVSFLAVSVVTTLLVRQFLADRLEQQLAAAGDRFATALPTAFAADDTQFDRVPGQAAGTLGARVVAGRVVAAGVVARGDEVISPGTATRAALGRLRAGTRPRTLDLPGLGDYLVEVQADSAGDLLVTGLPLEPLDDIVAHLVRFEAIVFAVVLVSALGVGLLAVRRALQPLEEIAATASRIADLPLSRGHVSLPDRSTVPDERTEVGSLAGSFNRMLDHVEVALRHRHEGQEQLHRFVADAGHELRTPVATIHARAEQARRELDAPQLAHLDHILGRVEAESARMGLLVDDLLTLARVDGDLELAHEPVDLTLLVLEVVEDARVVAPAHVWRLELPVEPVTTLGDPTALRRLVINLVANARTHTPPGTVVTVSVTEPCEDGHDEAVIVVADDGPGIPADLLPTVFERFVRTTASRPGADASGGTGLGLAIVHGIAARHGGAATVASGAGGSTFRVTLPRAG